MTARLTRIASGMIVIAAAPLSAQVTTAWQATTATMWTSDDGCTARPTRDDRSVASSGTVAGVLGLAGHGRASIDLSGAIAGGERGCRGNRWSGVVAARVAFGWPDLRFWMGYSASEDASADSAVRLPGPSAGIERRLGRAVVSMSVGPRRDRSATERVIELTERRIPEQVWPLEGTTVTQETVVVADTVTRPGRRRVPDVALGLSWTRGALGIDAAAHVAFARGLQHADPLARLQMTYDLGTRVSAMAGVLSRRPIPSLDIRARHVATVGLRISGGGSGRTPPTVSARVSASEFRAVSETTGEISLAVRAVGAQRVEVAGDFTHWVPLDLQRASDGWWRARVRAAPGSHQLSIRIDAGSWSAPPGLPPMPDEFGATV